jgi:hypothetical protein
MLIWELGELKAALEIFNQIITPKGYLIRNRTLLD